VTLSWILSSSRVASPFGALTAYRAVWLSLHAGIAVLVALLLKLRVAETLRPHQAANTQSTMSSRRGSAVATSKLAAEARVHQESLVVQRAGCAWMGPLGNVCTIAALVLVQVINFSCLGGTARGVVPTAPLLLLLHPHVAPFSRLSDSGRYAPVAFAVSLFFFVAACSEVGARSRLGALSLLSGVFFLICALPSQLLCLVYLWDRRRTPSLLRWCVLPLNALPLLLASSRDLRDPGLLGLGSGVLHIAMTRRVQVAGLRYI